MLYACPSTWYFSGSTKPQPPHVDLALDRDVSDYPGLLYEAIPPPNTVATLSNVKEVLLAGLPTS